MTGRCFRCDGVGCAECLDLHHFDGMARALASPDHEWPKQTRENIAAFRRAKELARTHQEWCDFRESAEAGEPERPCDCWLEPMPCCGQPDTCERDCPLDGEA